MTAISMETTKQPHRRQKMEGERPVSTSTLCSGTSEPSRGSSRTHSSLRTSLEEALVQEYSDRFITTSLSPSDPHLLRKYTSPYASKGSRDRGSKRQSARLTPEHSPLSSALTKSGHGRRPHSAPIPQLRRSLPFSQPPPVFKRQPAVIRVIAHKNGLRQNSAKIAASNFTMLLEQCTSRLKLISAARRIFLEDGREAFRAEDVPKDADVYISSGEPFVDPQKEIRVHLSLSKEASWTIGGVALPTSRGRSRTRTSLSRRLRGLSQPKATLRVLAFRNGAGSEGCEVVTAAGLIEQFLDLCTQKLHLTSRAKLLYDWEGNRVEDIGLVPPLDGCLQSSVSPLRGPVWVSRGEWFSPAGAKLYIQGVVRALRGRLRPTGEHLRQLDLALENNPEKVSKKEILSLTVREMNDAREKAQRQVEELQVTIRKHRGQLSSLAPQIRAEQEQPGGYVSGHVRPLTHVPPLPQGLQLKVYENGQDTGETVVYINMGEVNKGCEDDKDLRMNRVIHQRLQARAGYNPVGPRIVPTSLFDERGEAIRSPALLRNEQSVWVSYGEDYRSPREAVLGLVFERAIATGDGDCKAIYRAPLDPDTELPVGFRKWEAWEGFPSNCVSSPLGSCHLANTMDLDAHFIQLKADPQMILFPSAVVVNRTRPARPNLIGKKVQVVHSLMGCLSHMWIITKAGLILSRALPQLCLAVSSQATTVMASDGAPTEALTLNIQKRVRGCPYQEWSFGTDGCIFPRVRSEFVLTYLEDLHVSKTTRSHQGAQAVGQQETDVSVAPEVSGYSVSDINQNQAAGPTDTLVEPAGTQGESVQLTVALLRRRKGKQPQASAQRWAIRQERLGRSGQRNRSKVENPLWNKLTYTWPTLPDGELNQDLTWPLEGALVPCAPPLTDLSRKPPGHVPLRLRVLRNGQQGGQAQAFTVTAPNTTNMLKTRRKPKTSAHSLKGKVDIENFPAQEDDSAIEIHRLEFQQLLERCTESLNLPFAARRLFDKDGKEISLLAKLQRDQLVYVSCGEQWVDPQLSRANRKRRLLLNNLEWDASLVRCYCAMRDHQDLVLEVVGELTEGARLSVAECCMSLKDASKEENPEPANQDTEKGNGNEDQPTEDSHSKAHRKLNEKHSPFRYSWQENLEHEDNGIPSDKEEGFTSVDLYNKYRLQPRQGRVPHAHRQQFEFREGQIVSFQSPELVVGVKASEGAWAGTALQLLHRNPNDTNQRWILREEDRTLHLLANPGLVLAVSMPKITPGHTGPPITIQGCPVLLQKHKPHSYGAANQKWGWLPEVKVLSAFYTTELDQTVTAAAWASLCTACVSPEPLHQQGFLLFSSSRTERTEVCSTCAKMMRGEHVLQELPPNSIFCCSTNQRDTHLSANGPFKSLIVCQTDLSASAAEGTLHSLEERLDTLRMETRAQETATGHAQLAVRILARRNGRGEEGGQLITEATVPLILSQCTHKLQLPRAASHLYTADGTQILTVPQLQAWAVNECLQEHCADAVETAQPANYAEADMGGSSVTGRAPPSYEPLPQVTAEDLDTVDEALQALILKTPIDIWVSCGEPFLSFQAVQRRQRQQRTCWLQKEKLLADLVIKRHKMRHLQGRRITGQRPARMVPTQSPVQPVVMEGGWMEPSQEEVKLMEDLQSLEVHLAEVEASQAKSCRPALNKRSKSVQDLYNQLDVKRVLAYRNGDPKQVFYVWGQSIEELLNNGTSRLGLPQPATHLYTAEGGPLHTWADIEKDMLVCLSAGEPFLTTKDCREKIEMRARYSRARKGRGPNDIQLEMELSEAPAITKKQ